MSAESKIVKEPKTPPVKAPVKRKPRAKPTREEIMKTLDDSAKELRQIMSDLKEDEGRIQGLNLKQLPARERDSSKFG